MLKGNLCPDVALIKLAGLRTLVHEGPARVFESEGDCARAVALAQTYGDAAPPDGAVVRAASAPIALVALSTFAGARAECSIPGLASHSCR